LNLETGNLTDEQFYHLCQANQTWNLERNQKGELLIMPPVGGNTGKQEAKLSVKVGVWNEQTQLGEVFSSSTIFRLPNGGDRSPDVAWIKRERWEALSAEEREKFPPLCPDFVIELRSRTDSLTSLQDKMREYLASGLRLGWLINPQQQQVEIYRLNSDGEIINLPAILSGEDVLPGFVLNLT
ncbi:MAG: Uma2 family endonuclease, partial [Microcystis sp. M114S2]|uniref:Uma2 family endonuclease n=1 Tax=Microcystis sp. M114S2 TaxID=2771140 RepID=UPI00258DF2B2